MKQVKCEHCKKWTNGELKACEFCQGRLNEKYLEEQEEMKKVDVRVKMPLLKIDPQSPWYIKLPLHLVRIGQIIFLAIVTFLAYMGASLSG